MFQPFLVSKFQGNVAAGRQAIDNETTDVGLTRILYECPDESISTRCMH